MVKSTLYRLNLSMSEGPLYCTEESLYNEVQAVQAELVHVWSCRLNSQYVKSMLYRLKLSMCGGALELYR